MAWADIPITDASWYATVAAQVAKQTGRTINLAGVRESDWPAAIYAPQLVGAGELETDPIRVFVEHNRWIAPCPFCMSAQAASKTDRWFLCVECGNSAVAGLRVPTLWPDDWESAEVTLRERPPKNRHWNPWVETVGDLVMENRVRMGLS